MNHLTVQVLFGMIVATGLAPQSAPAQHEGHGHAEKAPPTAAVPMCPVMDEPVNLAVSVATDDGPVFFCCKDCITKYQADPAKYAAQVSAQRKALADRPKIQVTCPVSKDPVDPKAFTDTDKGKVYFCCSGCINKFKADPAKYAVALANSYTYQTQCPVMEEEINPKSFTTLANGHKVYFCCDRCENKLFAKPSEYLPRLKAQGYDFKPEEMAHEKAGGHDDTDDHGAHGHGGR
ncbi:MAG: hypothetical protein C4547_03015 [Phycisphaerales bacterium]|nr:MAG: hypothetical protein C4547_03015 [Phycisphaerales bacterium]